MFFHILKKDLKRKKTMNLILLLFIILASMFLASSVNSLAAVNGAVEHFMKISKVPDFFAITIQDGKEDAIGDYLQDNSYLLEYAYLDAYSIGGDQIAIAQSAQYPDGGSYEQSNVLYLSTVPENFMKVFDLEGNTLHLQTGEIALHKIEAEINQLAIGDSVKIRVGSVEQEFRVAAILKDAVFGSSMMGTRRHVISQEDFEKYQDQGDIVFSRIHCVQFQDEEAFRDGWKKQNFSAAFNGDWDLIKTCYILDMLIAAVFIVVSVCLILIAFLVLRFTIVFTLQEDYKEIGIMKAIGVPERGIKGIYLVKYFAISLIGTALGFLLSFPFGNMLLKQAIVNIIVEKADQNYMINIVCAVAVVVIVLVFCYGSTNKLKKFSALDAIRSGSNGERYQAKNRIKLSKQIWMQPCYYMAVNDIFSSLKRFAVLGITFAIGTMLIQLPYSVISTLRDANVVRLFSGASSDVYMDNGKFAAYIEQENIAPLMQDLTAIEEILAEHQISAKTGADIIYVMPCYAEDPEDTYMYNTLQAVGSWERHYAFLEGREPEWENEIMITDKTAKEMGVSIGDSIYFKRKDSTQEFVITGIYQSMLNMGNGFRVSRCANMDYAYASSLFCIQIEIEDMDSSEACERLKEIFPNDKIRTSAEFIDSMTGSMMAQLDVMMVFIIVIVLIINSLITLLMMKTIMTKERGDIALLKSIGFGNVAIQKWQSARIFIILLLAIMAGTILSNLFAPYIIGPIFSIMGASKITLEINPINAYFIYPLMLLIVTGVSAVLCSTGIRKVDLKEVNSME